MYRDISWRTFLELAVVAAMLVGCTSDDRGSNRTQSTTPSQAPLQWDVSDWDSVTWQ